MAVSRDAAAYTWMIRHEYGGCNQCHADPTGEFLHAGGALASDHGGPVWPVMRFYHNTLLRETPVFRDNYLFGLGVAGMRQTERDVFNNLFVQMDKVPGVNFVAVTEAGPLREGGNVLWGVKDGPSRTDNPFAKFRSTALFKKSQVFHEPGWTTDDRVADPRFVRLTSDTPHAVDLRLQADSPAVNTGVSLPAAWPDPFREADAGLPDIGALPLGESPWGVGIDGRIPLFGEGSRTK